LEPLREAGLPRPLDGQPHPELNVATEGNVPDREAFAPQISALLERLVGYREQLRALQPRLVDGLHVAFLGRRSHEAPEDRAERRLKGVGPFHPALRVRPGTRVLGPECAGAMPRGKITPDGVRLPQHEAIVLEA